MSFIKGLDIIIYGETSMTMFMSLITAQTEDARSVSFYPYNRSQILQYVEYTK